MYATALGNALCGRPLAGVSLWMVAAGSYPDYDGYTCRIPGTEEAKPGTCDDSTAVALVLRSAQRMASLKSDCSVSMLLASS